MFLGRLLKRKSSGAEPSPVYYGSPIQAGDSLDSIVSRCGHIMAAHANGHADSMAHEIAAAIWTLAQEIRALKVETEALTNLGPKKPKKRA